MDRDPGDFKRDGLDEVDVQAFLPAKPVEDMTEDEFDAWMEALPPPPGFPTTDEDLVIVTERARADVAAGRVHSHEVVSKWLLTWGKGKTKPFHEWLAEQNG